MQVRAGMILSALLLLGLLSTNPAVAGEVFTFPFDKEVPAGSQPVLDISNTSGSITITSSESKAIKIQAFKKVKARDSEEAEKIASHIDINVATAGDKVTVETEFEDFKGENFWEFLFGRKASHSAWVDYQVWVPEKCQLLVSATSADIQITRIKENVQISA